MSPRSSTASGKSGTTAVKSTVKTTAAKPATTKTRPAAARPRRKAVAVGPVVPENRMRLIAEAAYYKAEKRAFAGGSELGDWIEAEAEIDALLNARGAD
jgi:hypothetical protein